MSKRTLCRVLAWPAAGVVPLLAAGCGADPRSSPAPRAGRVVAVVARDFRFDPGRIVAAPGEPVILSVENRGTARYSLVLDLGGEIRALGRILGPGEVATMSFTAPRLPGDHVFYCPIGDHRATGMEGHLTIVTRRLD